jgi:hypothetical protein
MAGVSAMLAVTMAAWTQENGDVRHLNGLVLLGKS